MENVGIVCFASCYAIALALEVFRLRAGLSQSGGAFWRTIEIGVVGLGLYAHSAYIYYRAVSVERLPLSSPQDWLLVAAWTLCAIALAFVSTYREKNLGLVLLPPVLGVIILASFLPNDKIYAMASPSRMWGALHGGSMLLAAVATLFGFLAGGLYLRQARCLKNPRCGAFAHGKSWIKMPSLEWLYNVGRIATKFTATMLGLGVLSGFVLNQMNPQNLGLWSDWTVWGTILLFLWFVISLTIGFFWRRAQGGDLVAYRTIASFVALCVLFGIVIFSEHRHRQTWDAHEGEKNLPEVEYSDEAQRPGGGL
ncbi:MAG: hypothetical protein Q4D38_01500 [Planctomycetia bacterium]|nr:hypothetical protein [Planctomycetia bacterium]